MDDQQNGLKNSIPQQTKEQSNSERIAELSHVINELNQLCSELDPYKEIPTDVREKLSKYGVFEEDNPFVITNKIVLILENSVEELIELGGDPLQK